MPKLNGLATALMLLSAAAWAQQWEFGASGGGSIYGKKTVTGATAAAEASFRSGVTAGFYLGQAGGRVGGDISYEYAKNDMQLSSAAGASVRGGYSQAIHYDLLLFTAAPRIKVRPYLLLGGGMKQYTGTGADVAFPPGYNIAVLTRTSQWQPLLVTGAGIRVALSRHAVLRVEMRGNFTPVPKDVITPAAGAKLDGWLFQYAPRFSLGYVF
jgi:hypothetical protein